MGESWDNKRERLFKRDRHRCRRCEKESSGSLTLHHIIPRAMYGSDEDENLITLCRICHDWVELHLEHEPFLRTRTGIINSMPSVQYRIVENFLNKPLQGEKLLGDKIDIWVQWKKQGRKGAIELIERYGTIVPDMQIKAPDPKQPRLTKEISEEDYNKVFKSAKTNPMLRQILEQELNRTSK